MIKTIAKQTVPNNVKGILMEQIAKNAISDSEFIVLNCLGNGAEATGTTEVTEISSTTGIKDNDEVLRALYTLEGKNLVSPEPAGDFTSNHWQITPTGLKALKLSPALVSQ